MTNNADIDRCPTLGNDAGCEIEEKAAGLETAMAEPSAQPAIGMTAEAETEPAQAASPEGDQAEIYEQHVNRVCGAMGIDTAQFEGLDAQLGAIQLCGQLGCEAVNEMTFSPDTCPSVAARHDALYLA